MTEQAISRWQRVKHWIEQLDTVLHQRPEEILATDLSRQQVELETLRERVASLEGARQGESPTSRRWVGEGRRR